MTDDEYVDLMENDWGDSIDDADGMSYERFTNEPQEDTYDPEDDYDYDTSSYVTCPSASGGKHCGNCVPDYEEEHRISREAKREAERFRIIKNDTTTERKKEIMRWLYHSMYSKNFSTNNGFFINSGPTVKLKNGLNIDIVKWLFTEGMGHNRYVSGYIAVHKEKSELYAEKVMFFKVSKAECERAEAYHTFVETIGEFKIFKPDLEGIQFTEGFKRLPVDESTIRQKEILEWLKNSKFKRKFVRGNGFYVIKGAIVRLKNGEELDILDWLVKEGFDKCKRVSNYNVKYSEQSNEFPTMLHFFELLDNG